MILKKHLHMSEISAKWAAHLLIEDQKKQRLKCTRERLKKNTKNCNVRVTVKPV